MTSIFDKVTEWHHDNDMTFDVQNNDRNPGVYDFISGIQADESHWAFRVTTDDDDGVLMAHSVMPMNVPASRHDSIVRLITRINYSLIQGSYVLDHRDGEISFRTSVRTGTDTVSDELVYHLLGVNLSTYAEHATMLSAVAFGTSDPDDIYEHFSDRESEEEEPKEEEAEKNGDDTVIQFPASSEVLH